MIRDGQFAVNDLQSIFITDICQGLKTLSKDKIRSVLSVISQHVAHSHAWYMGTGVARLRTRFSVAAETALSIRHIPHRKHRAIPYFTPRIDTLLSQAIKFHGTAENFYLAYLLRMYTFHETDRDSHCLTSEKFYCSR